MDETTLAAINAFNNSLTNNANVIMASNTSSEDRAFSREMSDLSWQRNIEAWNMQNEYNLPANQYARQLAGLRANGMNPNLVYGNSSSVSSAAQGVSPYKFENYHSTAVPQFRGQANAYMDLLNTRYLQTQVAAQEAQNRLINARADNEEARNPGISAKSNEAAARWRYILGHMDDQEGAWRAEQALTYWKGQQSFSTAEILKNKARMSYYEAAMAEWLNTTNVPGTNLTYQQYYEQYRSMIPSAEYSKLKAAVLDIGSQIAYRAKQGNLLDLKIEYQRYVNRYAALGRTLGNDWINLLISGLMWFFNPNNPAASRVSNFLDPDTNADINQAEWEDDYTKRFNADLKDWLNNY